MMKKTVSRSLVGAPIGLAISIAITIIISLSIGDGRYHAVVPEAAAIFGSELNAFILQTVLSMVYGAVFGAASLVWESERSLLSMTVTHLLICSAVTFPVAYFLHWMEHSPLGVARYFGTFIAVYAAIWASMYFSMKRRIKAMNARMNDR